MLKRFIIISLFFPYILFSQIQNTSYNSLNLNSSSRILSMGSDVISVVDNDVSLALFAPSLLNKRMHNQVSFNFVDYVSDINFISFHFSKIVNKNLMLFSGFDAINYGSFIVTDEVGNQINNFNASQQITTIGSSKYLGRNFTFGANIRLLNSQMETYHSVVISSNISTTYHNRESNFTSTLLFKNIGRPVKSYTSENEKLPYEIQFGLSKYLKYLPFRYSLVFHHLNVYDISSNYNPNTFYDPVSNQIIIKDETVAKKLLRHVIIGGELNPFRKSLYFRFGVNFQRREDLKLTSVLNMSGFSWGMGFSIKNIQINYARSAYHTSSMINSFSVITNLTTFGL